MNHSQGSRRHFRVWCLLLQLVACAAQAAQGQFPQLLDATFDELRQGLDSGQFSSVDLTKAYIARINEVNAELHAVNEINPDALAIAAELDKSRRNGQTGLLHGIPVLLKDNIATNDKMNNTAGSFALRGAKVLEDSTAAAKLRIAGAVILGKTTMSEWASFRSDRSTSGWSAVGGQAIGAYFPEQDPSGSSSGSGISSSVGLAWACLGTDTSGSIIAPSQQNNLVGIKPSVGLTSRHLVVPISEHMDTVGPMARTVKDAAYLLAAIAGKDDNDGYTSDIPFGDRLPDYVGACKTSGLEGKRIGVPRSMIGTRGHSAYELQKFDETLDVLRASGATIVDNIDLPGLKKIRAVSDFVSNADFITGLPKLYLDKLATNPNNIKSLVDLMTFTQNDPREEYPRRDTNVWQQALKQGYGNDSPQFRDAYEQQVYLGGTKGLRGALEGNSLDALFAPSYLAAYIASHLGDPVITVPIGRMPEGTPVTRVPFGTLNAKAPNQPVGVAFAGARFSEESLIGMAYTLEQKTGIRKTISPRVVPKTELQDVVGM